jgi:hypothetical protein
MTVLNFPTDYKFQPTINTVVFHHAAGTTEQRFRENWTKLDRDEFFGLLLELGMRLIRIDGDEIHFRARAELPGAKGGRL